MEQSKNEIAKLIQAEIDRKGGEVGSVDELNKIAVEIIERHNQDAFQDFEGLSPQQMHLLMNTPFSPGCPVVYKQHPKPEVINNTPVMRVCSVLIRAMSEGDGIKLTPKGYLPRKIVGEIFSLNLYQKSSSRYPIEPKPFDEIDYVPAAYTRGLMQLAGFTKVRNNKLTMTKAGLAATKDPVMLFQRLFTAFMAEFHKGYLDGFQSDHIGNIGALYIIYLLKRYGLERREAGFYVSRYFIAFPNLLNDHQPGMNNPLGHCHDCYSYRIFDKGMLLFGLADLVYEGVRFHDQKLYIQATEVFHEVF
jgi:hypothetical protein